MNYTMSTLLFLSYYANPTYETWRYKIHPKYPTPQMVRSEIILMLQGNLFAAFCPALSFYLTTRGRATAFCGSGGYTWHYHLFSFFLLWLQTDLFEWVYHWMGHRFKFFWNQHKYHHLFYNPSPFAVIADDWADQFIRTLPMLVVPLLMPINLDLLWGVFACFFLRLRALPPLGLRVFLSLCPQPPHQYLLSAFLPSLAFHHPQTVPPGVLFQVLGSDRRDHV